MQGEVRWYEHITKDCDYHTQKKISRNLDQEGLSQFVTVTHW